jgi:hypothetical protein
LNEAYRRVERFGDRLAEIGSMVDWEASVSPDRGDMYDNRSERGCGPNIDEVVMGKLLVLPQWHGLALRSRTREAGCGYALIHEMKFLGYPKDIPDFTTVWYFREQSGW